MRDFIITSLQPWDIEIGSTIKNTALEISKQHRVLYISPPLNLITRLKRRGKESTAYRRRIDVIRGKVSPIRRINENLWVSDCPFTLLSINKLPAALFDFFNRKNNRKLGKWIVEQASGLGFKEYIHLIDTDLYRSRYLKEYIRPAISIYYRRDYIIGFPYWRKHGPRCEEALVRQSDIVLANSSYFAGQLRPWNSRTCVLNTGVNLDLYNPRRPWEQPEDLKNIPSPVIGYTGAIIESRLDSSLLYETASQLPQYSFVFVGPEDRHFEQHPLHRLKNVYFTGRKEVEQLPQYIRYFDVCINPQVLNPITDGNYPLKIDEYPAMGKPVVATSTHTMRDVFADYTYLAGSTPLAWVDALHTAVTEATDAPLREKRIAFAQTHSWENSVKKIYETIKEYEHTQTLSQKMTE